MFAAELPETTKCAMEASESCRLCGGVADYKHQFGLFSPLNTKKVYLEE